MLYFIMNTRYFEKFIIQLIENIYYFQFLSNLNKAVVNILGGHIHPFLLEIEQGVDLLCHTVVYVCFIVIGYCQGVFQSG